MKLGNSLIESGSLQSEGDDNFNYFAFSLKEKRFGNLESILITMAAPKQPGSVKSRFIQNCLTKFVKSYESSETKDTLSHLKVSYEKTDVYLDNHETEVLISSFVFEKEGSIILPDTNSARLIRIRDNNLDFISSEEKNLWQEGDSYIFADKSLFGILSTDKIIELTLNTSPQLLSSMLHMELLKENPSHDPVGILNFKCRKTVSFFMEPVVQLFFISILMVLFFIFFIST
jgi:hypothetical protein